MGPIKRVILTALAALVGFVLGGLGGCTGFGGTRPENYPHLVHYVPLPHHVPKYPGGLSFRFAMAHDVIHERFPKHGPAYYRERERLTRERLAKLSHDDPATFSLADDLAAGLERLGKSDEAVAVMRAKLRGQQAMGLVGRERYTSYANLGTFLIHASAKQAIAGDAKAKERFREGVGFVRKSVEVNPEAHFGREKWQVAIAEFILAAMDDPGLLKKYDCIGDSLGLDIERMLDRETFRLSTESEYGRPTKYRFGEEGADRHMPAEEKLDSDYGQGSYSREYFRTLITTVGAEQAWGSVPSHREPVPFDEPAMGIIGMWRQGGGASPHFALALGEIMLRVGQRYIAWAAFERASRLADRYWPDPNLQQFLRDHCRKRQEEIEETLTFATPPNSSRPPWQHVSPPPPSETVANLRSQFEAELARGESYQKAYQEYETAKIAAGVLIGDEHFYDEVNSSHEPIASPSGPEEWFAAIHRSDVTSHAFRRALACGTLGAGLAAMAVALFLRRREARKKIGPEIV